MDINKYKTVACIWCGKPTVMLGTKMCHAHWELFHRIEREPGMTRRMLDAVKQETAA